MPKEQILCQILSTLSENNINNVCTLTFDGAPTNLSMISHLGGKTRSVAELTFSSTSYNERSYFRYPRSLSHVKVGAKYCRILANG